MSTQKEGSTISPTTTSTSGALGTSQQNTASVPISLLTCLIPTGTIGINVTNFASALATTRLSSMFLQSYNDPFTYWMPTWTPTPTVATMQAASGIPSNLFNPTSFWMSHIPHPIPSLESGYHPCTSYPVHSGTTQIGYGNTGIPEHGGGYYPSQSYNLGNFNMPGGNTVGIGRNIQHNTPNWGTGGLPGILFLETLNLPDLTKLTNDHVAHLP